MNEIWFEDDVHGGVNVHVTGATIGTSESWHEPAISQMDLLRAWLGCSDPVVVILAEALIAKLNSAGPGTP